MKDKKVEYLEIWETSGESPFMFAKKLIAIVANGHPFYLAKDFILEKGWKTQKELDKIGVKN